MASKKQKKFSWSDVFKGVAISLLAIGIFIVLAVLALTLKPYKAYRMTEIEGSNLQCEYGVKECSCLGITKNNRCFGISLCQKENVEVDYCTMFAN